MMVTMMAVTTSPSTSPYIFDAGVGDDEGDYGNDDIAILGVLDRPYRLQNDIRLQGPTGNGASGFGAMPLRGPDSRREFDHCLLYTSPSPRDS